MLMRLLYLVEQFIHKQHPVEYNLHALDKNWCSVRNLSRRFLKKLKTETFSISIVKLL